MPWTCRPAFPTLRGWEAPNSAKATTPERRNTGAAPITAITAPPFPTFRRWSWNDTAINGFLAASGGGVSKLFSKPSWQTGAGVPADGQRDVPDLALNSSADHDGYLICSQSSCVNGYRKSDQTLTVIGGTSAAAPTFAGIVALIVQKTNDPQGNVNQYLYSLAASSPNAFHDITTGDNMVPCTAGSTDCPASGMIGYSAGPGYDLTTGLGSVDAGALVAAWNGPTNPDFQVSAQSQSLTITRGTPATDTLTVTGLAGFSQTVDLSCSVSSDADRNHLLGESRQRRLPAERQR